MSSLILGNPAGLWALLGLPAVLAIHFLQPRSHRVVITTLFLLEHLPPMATTGRAWRWLRSSWALWLQLLAVTLIAWLLAEPRWLRPDSVQTIAIVLDASASMRAFRADAIAALRDRMPAWERGTARTEWVVRETDLARPVLYRGYDRTAALAVLAEEGGTENAPRWKPDLGTHDFAPALGVASRLVRRAGAAVLVTDRRPTTKLEGIALLSVGHPIENTGFAGGSVQPAQDGKPRWTILVQHRGATPAQRTLTIAKRHGAVVRTEPISLEANRLLTLSGDFPEGADALVFKLSGDAFDLDDNLPLVAPHPRVLTWRVSGDDENATKFFRRFLERSPALVAAAENTTPDIAVVANATPPVDNTAAASLLEIDFIATTEKLGRVATAPIVNESHPWFEGLAWSGLLGAGPVSETLPPGARALLWQGEKPLAWLAPAGATPRLVLAWDWPASNADRLPASAVLLFRLVDDARRRKVAPETINVDAGQTLELPAAAFASNATWTISIDGASARRIAATDEAALRAPTTPGFFSLQRGDETYSAIRSADSLMITGAAQFADPREADFADAATLAEPEQLPLDVLEDRTTADRWKPLWLLLLGGALLASWAVQAPRRAAAVQKGVA